MVTTQQLDKFLSELDARHRRLSALVPDDGNGSAKLHTEIADLGEQLQVADELLRVQQEQLAETRALVESAAASYERFLDASPQLLVLTDENGSVLHASRGVLAMGYRDAGLAPRPIATWFVTADRARVRSAITALQHQPDRVIDLGRLVVRLPGDGEEAVTVTVSVAVQSPTGEAQLLWNLHPVAQDGSVDGHAGHAVPTVGGFEVAERLTALAVALSKAESTWDALEEITRQAAAFFPQTTSADLFLPRTTALTSDGEDTQPTLDILDELQHRLNVGPAVDALAGLLIVTADVTVDPRWTELGTLLPPGEVRSVLAVPLVAADRIRAALVWQSEQAGIFGDLDATAAEQFAVQAGLGLQRLLAAEQTGGVSSSRQQLGQAVDILVERLGLTPAAALDMLVRASQHTGAKPRDLAARLIETGELPLVPPKLPSS